MSMAKTIMIAEETYQKLKRLKEQKKMSFTQVVEALMEKENKEKWKKEIMALRGTWLEDRDEDEEVERILKEGWKKWNKRYASTRM